MSTVRTLALGAMLLGFSSVALGEAGSPRLLDPFDSSDIAPINALIPIRAVNGVPFGLTQLRKLEPRLVSEAGSVPLKIVDSFDDLEGHTTPFPDDGGGYGDNLILLAPRWRLLPNTTYAFTVGTGEHAYFKLSTGNVADTTPPRWRQPPFLDPTPPEGDQPLMPSYIVTALAEPPELPLHVIVELKPLEAQAKPKRMIASLQLASRDSADCAFVTIWDHANGVRTEDTDSDLGRRYLATLTAVDAAGNQRRAPGSGVQIVWSGSLAICNKPEAVESRDAKPSPSRWLAKPSHKATRDHDFVPSHSTSGAGYTHAIDLPLETTTIAFVELTIRRSKAPYTGYRRIALLGPTIPAPAAAGDEAAPGVENCVEPLITNVDREKPMPGPNEPVTVRVAVVDSFGRRLAHPGEPLTVAQLHPSLSRVLVCARANPTQQATGN